MREIAIPPGRESLERMRMMPWLSSLGDATSEELQRLLQCRWELITRPDVRATALAMIDGRTIGMGEEGGVFYLEIAGLRGGEQRYVTEPLSSTQVETSLPFLGGEDRFASELLGQCHLFHDSAVSSFADFLEPTPLRAHIEAFRDREELTVFRARRLSMSQGWEDADTLILADWVMLYYDAAGFGLALSRKLETAWYLHDLSRLVIMPLDLAGVANQMRHLMTKGPWFDVYTSMDLAGVSRAYSPGLP